MVLTQAPDTEGLTGQIRPPGLDLPTGKTGMIPYGVEVLHMDEMRSFDIDRDLFEVMRKAIGGWFSDGAGFH